MEENNIQNVEKKKNNLALYIIVIGIIILVGVGIGYYFYKNRNNENLDNNLKDEKMILNNDYEKEGKLEEYNGLYNQAKIIGEKYDVTIAIADQVPDSMLSSEKVDGFGSSERLFDKEKIKAALDKIDQILSLYPKNFFSQLKYDNFDNMRIYVIGFCSNGMGIAGTSDKFHYIILGAENYNLINEFDYNLNHEISHIIDRTLLYISNRESGHLYSEEEWNNYNPEGFKYAYGNDDLANELYSKYFEYFDYSYGVSNPTEDRATIFGHFMSQYMKDKNNMANVLQYRAYKKLDYYSECIRDGFDTTDWPEKTPWEYRIKKDLNLSSDIYGTYYNEEENELYFTLKSDGTAIIVESSCGEGAMAPFTVSYEIYENNGTLSLVFSHDYRIMSQMMIGTKYGDNYRFTVTENTCVANPNETYYYKK